MTNYEFSGIFPHWLTESIALPPYFWNINSYMVGGDHVEFAGWALPWYGRPFNKFLRREDGVRVDLVSSIDKAMASHFPYWANAATAPFSARTEMPTNGAEYVSVESADGSPLAHPIEQFSRWLFVPTTKEFPVPPANIISHIGESSADYYLMSGCTLFNGFKSAFVRYAERPFLSVRRVLDWGCGPGRVGVHLIKEILNAGATTQYVGVDIDTLSLQWAKRTLAGNLVLSQRMPPLPFPNEHFDFIFGYSVFTHLDRPTQEAWLIELQRICVPGGLAAVTVMSELALFFFEPFLSDIDARARFTDGVYAAKMNNQLEESGIGGDYYRNVWLTRDFILTRWSEFFDVVAIHPNFHFYQDLVILRRR
jgi:SAM-dependent methyltransferase